ncbi:ABC transporter permease [Streptomyces cellulosae]|uniref:ABC transporter permease n=1 Tax=Streptomyces cellulosae TaxID=1968 RepID=UPI0004C978F6|nr:FtsX-like permease family protein [Streptomyces cellulosae]
MLRTVLRSVHRDRRRFVLPALAVLIGVACVSGSLLYSQSLQQGALRLQRAFRPDVSVEVRPASGSVADTKLPDEALRRRLSALPGAAAARGTLEGPAFLVARDGRLVGPRSAALGVNFVPGERGADPRYPMLRGSGPRGPGEVAVDRWSAQRGGYRVGDRLRIVVAGEVRSVRLAGVFTVHDPRTAGGGTVTAFDKATARALFASVPGTYQSVTLTARPGATDRILADRAARVLPAGFEAVTRADLEAEAAAAPDREKLTTLLLIFAGVALFVSAFLVGNTFTMLSAARAREHALLRAVGASRARVLRMVLGEAALVGTLAAVAGHLAGVGVAAVLGDLFQAAGGAQGEVAPLEPFSFTPVLTALGVGVAVTAASAYVPALRASRVAPVAALRTDLPAPALSLRRRNRLGSAATAAAALLLVTGGGELGLLALVLPLLLAGLVLVIPQLAQTCTGVLRASVARLAGVRGVLALANVSRNPRRTAATAGALTVCVALVSAVTVAVSSLSATARGEAEADVPTDLRVIAVDYAEVTTDTAARIARLPHVAAVSATRDVGFRLDDGSPLWATTVDPRAVGRLADFTVRAGSLDDLSRGVAVTSALAARHGWQVGDRISGTGFEDGPALHRPIVAVYDGPQALGPALLPDNALAGSGTVRSGAVDSVLVRAEPGRADMLKGRIRRALDNPSLLVQDPSDAGREAAEAYRSLSAVLYAMLSVTVAIGALGVANTMGMAVFERMREIGLLRAVGLDRSGVRLMLRAESVLVSLLGAGLGVFAGGAAGAAAVAGQEGAVLSVPWATLLACFLAAGVIGVLAAVGPGHRAAGIPVTRAVGDQVG